MKYFKIGDKVYDESYLKENSDLLLFGAMPKKAFLRRILRSYGIDLYYNLENKQIIIYDLENKCILENKPDSQLWNSNKTNVSLGFDEDNLFNINIKRQVELNITLKLNLVNCINGIKCNQEEHIKNKLNPNNDNLIEFKYSKYGEVEITNNKTDYSFKYNTENLNNIQKKPIAICINSLTNQNSINYNLKNGNLSTIYYNSNDIYCHPTENNSRKKDYLIPVDEITNLFNEEAKPLSRVITSDLDDLTQLVNISRLEYLRAYKKKLLGEMKNLFSQIKTAFDNMIKIKKEIADIDKEESSLTNNDPNNNRQKRKHVKNNNC